MLLDQSFQLHGGITEEIAKIAGDTLLDFSSNLNPFGPPDGLQEVISSADIEHYPPGYSALETALARFCGCSTENLLMTNGASEAFFFLSLLLRPRVTSLEIPGFSEYQNSVQAFGSAIWEIDGHPEKQFDTCRYFKAVEQSDVIFIGNPNNPDGRLIEPSVLEELIRYANEFATIVILDEAFIDFCGRDKFTMSGWVDKYDNLVIVGSLTKTFAIAGLRFGYIVAGKEFISRLKRGRPPWPISSTTSAAIQFCLGQSHYYKETIRKTNEYKEDFVLRLSRVGLKVFPSAANYILIKLPDGCSSGDLTATLLSRQFLIRDCRSFGLGDNFIRLAVKLPEQNDLLARALEETLSDAANVTAGGLCDR